MSRDYITGYVRLHGGPAPGTGEEDIQLSEAVDLVFGDNEELKFGDAPDFALKYDGSDLSLIPAADGDGFLIGSDSYTVAVTLKGTLTVGKNDTGHDVKLFGATSGAYLLWDESEDDLIAYGGAAFKVAEECTQAFKAEYNVTKSGGAWVHGVKVELTRAANIQPATGGWFGAQFVLNAGSSGYDALDKSAYALQVVFKGSDTNPNGVDIHVARFETQSAGKVSDICYITANTGTTIVGSLLYLATHVAPGNAMALLNVQSSQTVGKGLAFQAGAGSTLTSLLYCSGDGTFTNFLEVAASGDGGVTLGATMHKDPNDDDEAGFITIKVGATSYQIAFWAAS